MTKVQCSTCQHGRTGRRCRLHPRQPMYSRHWRTCDSYHPVPVPLSDAEVLASVRERIEDAGMSDNVVELRPHGRDIAIRLVRSAPYSVKVAIGQVLRS